MQQL
jgi:hypothetical protein